MASESTTEGKSGDLPVPAPTIDETLAAIRAGNSVPPGAHTIILVEFQSDPQTGISGFMWTINGMPLAEARRWLLADVADDMLREMNRLAAESAPHQHKPPGTV